MRNTSSCHQFSSETDTQTAKIRDHIQVSAVWDVEYTSQKGVRRRDSQASTYVTLIIRFMRLLLRTMCVVEGIHRKNVVVGKVVSSHDNDNVRCCVSAMSTKRQEREACGKEKLERIKRGHVKKWERAEANEKLKRWIIYNSLDLFFIAQICVKFGIAIDSFFVKFFGPTLF